VLATQVIRSKNEGTLSIEHSWAYQRSHVKQYRMLWSEGMEKKGMLPHTMAPFS